LDKIDTIKRRCFNITVGEKKVGGLKIFYTYRNTAFCPNKGGYPTLGHADIKTIIVYLSGTKLSEGDRGEIGV